MPTIQKLPKKRTNSINRVNRQKVYNTSTWKNIRASYLMQHPLCELCLKNDKVKPTEDIHHILGILKYPDLAYNTDNLLALCKECHSKIHSNHKESELENIYYERVANNT